MEAKLALCKARTRTPWAKHMLTMLLNHLREMPRAWNNWLKREKKSLNSYSNPGVFPELQGLTSKAGCHSAPLMWIQVQIILAKSGSIDFKQNKQVLEDELTSLNTLQEPSLMHCFTVNPGLIVLTLEKCIWGVKLTLKKDICCTTEDFWYLCMIKTDKKKHFTSPHQITQQLRRSVSYYLSICLNSRFLSGINNILSSKKSRKGFIRIIICYCLYWNQTSHFTVLLPQQQQRNKTLQCLVLRPKLQRFTENHQIYCARMCHFKDSGREK